MPALSSRLLEYWTTIRLTERVDEWTATERGGDATGVGATAQRAAADYCATVARKNEHTADEIDGDSDRVLQGGTAFVQI